MVDILHRVGVESASVDDVYAALTSIEGLAGWWASDTKGDANPGGVIEFRFTAGGFDMKVIDLQPGKRVLWEVVGGPEEWIGTEVVWDLKEEEGFTIILFQHRGWKEPGEFMYHCSTKWAIYLMSLKQLVETGTGAPDPRDVQISNWH
ncbi:SRPBCC domain-containing protein [Nocardia sp. XZ_19_369]|uniref:SRPBCC family protein n=1 Tax=Nocardia sp. XZ_19_369 TaxID=2769487 RepID=UPI0018909208|nr:SRPBCC domain-containing protein [Nocardia sp. XZ_19_369]